MGATVERFGAVLEEAALNSAFLDEPGPRQLVQQLHLDAALDGDTAIASATAAWLSRKRGLWLECDWVSQPRRSQGRLLHRDRSPVEALAVSNGKLISGHRDGRLLLHVPDVRAAAPASLGDAGCHVMSLAALGDGRVVSGDDGGRVLLWYPHILGADPGIDRTGRVGAPGRPVLPPGRTGPRRPRRHRPQPAAQRPPRTRRTPHQGPAMTPTRDQHEALRGDLPALANHTLDPVRHDQVTAHLAGCDDCRAEAADWEAIANAVRADVPARDQDLYDTTLAAIRRRINAPDATAERPEQRVAPVVELAARRRWPRIVLPRLAVAAAIVAIAVVVIPDTTVLPPEDLLLAAATSLEDAGGATVDITETGVATTTAPGGATVELPITITGRSVLDLPEASDSTVTFDVAGVQQTTQVIRVGGTAWQRTPPDTTFAALPPAAGSLTSGRIWDAAALLRAADGPVDELGAETIDGVDTRHLAFAPTPDALGEPGGIATQRIEAWIDADNNVRQLRFDITDHIPGELQGDLAATVTLTMQALDAPVHITAPPTRDEQ